nr:hypothetical protein [uncultured Desulfobacter sp.]
MNETCSLEEAALVIGVGSIQVLQIIDTHADIFSEVDTSASMPNINVPVSSLQAFESLYTDAYSFSEIANRLGVSIKRIQKITSTPGTNFLGRSFCAQQTCPESGKLLIQRKFPKKDAEEFIEYCETRSIFKFMQPRVGEKTFTYAALKKEDVICGSKAYRFKDAVEDGLNPQKYKYSDIAPMEYIGKLVFKIWGRTSSIHCFFILETNELIRLTAFRPRATPWRGYTPQDGKVDFSEPGIEGTRYRITTGLTKREIVSFVSATAS